MKTIFYIFIAVYILCLPLYAGEPSGFKADSWDEGIHLLAGVGPNASIYNSDVDRQNQSGGLNFKTDFGYFINSKWAIETGSQVRFTKFDEYLSWDTLLTIGIRHRFKDAYFSRIFFGEAPTVFFLDDSPDFYQRSGATRIQYSGPVYGLAFGEMRETESGKVWFLESGLSYQSLENAKGVVEKSGISEVVFESGSGDVKVYTLYFSVGLLVF